MCEQELYQFFLLKIYSLNQFILENIKSKLNWLDLFFQREKLTWLFLNPFYRSLQGVAIIMGRTL